MDIGKYIKELRTQKGISQEELGRIAGVQRAAVQKWESGRTQNLKRATIQPIYCNEEYATISICDDFEADFCLTAKGDSMINARIYDGDYVFCRAQPSVENGEIAAVVIGDEATLKRVYYYPEEGKLVLNAENPKYPPIVYVGEELNKTRIIGKAVAFQSSVR